MRLQEKYQKQVVPAMKEKFGYSSAMAVPKIEKVVVNSGFGSRVAGESSSQREKTEKNILDYLALITGQRPARRRAKKSISSFHLRKGMTVGATITLRGKRMYDFLERLIHLTLPRKRDFRGIPLKSITYQGDLTVGFRELTPFPEVKIDREKQVFGLEVTVVTTANSREEAIGLFRMMDFPLQK